MELTAEEHKLLEEAKGFEGPSQIVIWCIAAVLIVDILWIVLNVAWFMDRPLIFYANLMIEFFIVLFAGILHEIHRDRMLNLSLIKKLSGS